MYNEKIIFEILLFGILLSGFSFTYTYQSLSSRLDLEDGYTQIIISDTHMDMEERIRDVRDDRIRQYVGEAICSSQLVKWTPKITSVPSYITTLSLSDSTTGYNVGDTVVYSLHITNSEPLFAFMAEVKFASNSLQYIKCEEAGFISINKTKEVGQLYYCSGGLLSIGITRLGRNDTLMAYGDGLILNVSFLLKEQLSAILPISFEDIGLIAPDGFTRYPYQFQSLVSINSNNEDRPSDIYVFQNYPNPFNPSTKISYILMKPLHIRILLYDVMGSEISEIVNADKDAGFHEIELSSSRLPSGIYYCNVISEEYRKTIKMLLVK